VTGTLLARGRRRTGQRGRHRKQPTPSLSRWTLFKTRQTHQSPNEKTGQRLLNRCSVDASIMPHTRHPSEPTPTPEQLKSGNRLQKREVLQARKLVGIARGGQCPPLGRLAKEPKPSCGGPARDDGTIGNPHTPASLHSCLSTLLPTPAQ
jgi:hypothetical protein